MARVTFIAFALLSGFFYVTGKPVDDSGNEINRFADLANHKVIAENVLAVTSSKQMISLAKDRSENKRSDRSEQAAGPALPSRNPRRITSRSSKYANALPVLAPAAPNTNIPVTLIQLAANDTSQTFQQGRNKFTGGTVKPLGQGYQQKYVRSQKPVLGPRLTAVLVKRELKRIGCYRGNVTSVWNDSARAAITLYNTRTGSSLATKTPLVSSLEHLQQITKAVCVDEPVTRGTIIASAGQRKAQPSSKASPSSKSVKRGSNWRTNVQIRKATYLPAPTVRTPRYTIKRPRLIENYLAPPVVTPPKVKRSRRVKRIRVAKRKAKRRTAVRSWKKRYRRKKFGFRSNGGSFTLNN